MALNGLQIQKILPKTNCKECGSNTCLAFAMKLAAKKANLSECPYASEEAKALLGADSEPPVVGVRIGTTGVKIGEETVLYRHEKTFVNQTVIAVNINASTENCLDVLNDIKNYRLERVGEVLTIGAVSVTQSGAELEKFVEIVSNAHKVTGLPVIIHSGNVEALEKAAWAVKGSNSIIAPEGNVDYSQIVKIASENDHSLVISGVEFDEIYALTEKIKLEGFNNLIINFNAQSLAESFQVNSIARRAALKDGVKALGYPTLKFIDSGNEMMDTVDAISEINKYGGIVVLPSFDPAQLVVLMTLRLNIYTDPQKPIQVEPKVYQIGEPDRNSPVFVTTNFSLTYFIVSGEIENSGISAWLVIPECEGMSVLTAWAAGKFNGSHIAKFIKEIDLNSMVDTRMITIPGYVAQISGELEENLPGWTVSVGPQEAADLESYINTVLRKK